MSRQVSGRFPIRAPESGESDLREWELKLIKLAVSLVGTESLAEHPASMTHFDYAPEELEALGLSDGLVRISIGL